MLDLQGFQNLVGLDQRNLQGVIAEKLIWHLEFAFYKNLFVLDLDSWLLIHNTSRIILKSQHQLKHSANLTTYIRLNLSQPKPIYRSSFSIFETSQIIPKIRNAV